jgi:hypothetical protein
MRTSWLALIALITVAGCNPRPLFLQPRPQREWPPTLQAVKVAAREGRHADADSLLARFIADNPRSYEAREASYWRALMLIDPANRQASSAAALRAINQYFADGSTAEAYDEATVLRRVVQYTDSLAQTLAQARRLIAEAQEAAAEPAPAAPATPAAPAAAPSRETQRENRNLVEEVRRLRDELSKARAELERVRRRLSEQRP